MLLKFIENFYNKPLAEELLYPVCHENGVYLLADGAIGQAWEIAGISADGKSVESMQQISRSFASFLRVLPEDASMQLIYVVTRGAENIDTYNNGDMSIPYVADYSARKMQWHNKCKHSGFAKEGQSLFAPRTMKIYLTIRQNPIGISSLNLYNETSFRQTIEKIKNTTIQIETSLSSGGFGFKRIESENDLINIMYKMLNPERAVSIDSPLYRGGDIRKYLFYNSPELLSDGIMTDGIKYNVLSLANVPARPDDKQDSKTKETIALYTYPNILFAKHGDIELFDYAQSFFFTINFYMPPQEELKRSFNLKKTLSFLHRFNFIGDVAVDKEIEGYDMTRTLKLMYEGNKMLRASFHFCIPSQPAESDFIVSQVLSLLNVSSSCNAFKEDTIGHGIFMRSLPFGFDYKTPDENRFVRRAITISSSNLADIAPLYVDSKGIKTPSAIGYYNRRGESTWFDLFDKATSITSPHCLFTGTTGAGKSVTAVDFISQALRQPSTVVVIDKGKSYKRLCQLVGGQYLSFEGKTSYMLDPFDGDWSDNHRAFLASLLSVMATGGTEKISREEVAILSECVFKLQTSEQKTFDSLVKALLDVKPIGDSLAKKLYPFYGNGQYASTVDVGRMTADKKRLTLSSAMTVFELGDIDAYIDYQTVIVFLLIYYVTEYMKKIPGNKYLIIDEAWSLFRNDTAVDFLIKAVKTFRKLGCSIIFITQQLDDFMIIAKALNMKDNCPNKVLLYQEVDVVTRNAEQLELGEGEIELYKTIKKSKKYVEAMIKAQNWTAVARVTLDPKSYWAATTTEKDVRFIDNLIEEGKTLKEAIDYASEQYPYGVS